MIKQIDPTFQKIAQSNDLEIIRPIPSISSPKVYLAQKGSDFFILKKPESIWNEKEILKCWSGNAAPQFVDLGEIISLQYLSGRNPFYWQKNDVKKILRLFRNMEKHQPQKSNQFKRLDDLFSIIKEKISKSELSELSGVKKEALSSLEKAFSFEEERRVIHGDLHSGNIFMRDRAHIIDPYGLWGDPGFDLAFLAASLANDQREFIEVLNQDLHYYSAPLWFPGLVLYRLLNAQAANQAVESRILKTLAGNIWEI